MMPRKTRIVVLSVSIALVIIMALSVFGFLYFKTDMFKTSEELFLKYFSQGFNALEILKNEDEIGIDYTLANNKYRSELIGNIEYTENIETSAENKNNPINKVGIKVISNVDKQNNYDYRDVSLVANDENLVRVEYLNQDETYGVRLNEIKQFISTKDNETYNRILEDFEIKDIQNIVSELDIDSILNFTKEEKQNLIKTYTDIIQDNVTKDKYGKQKSSLITINNKDIQANAYYIKMTIEEYNNLYIKILQDLTNNEIILSRIDLIENTIKEKYSGYKDGRKLREKFINNLNEKIKEIQDNNIGSEEVRIIVYESDHKIIRATIENQTNTKTIDFNVDNSITINDATIGEDINQKVITIQKDVKQTELNILFKFEEMNNNKALYNLEIKDSQIINNNEISKNTEINLQNEKYKSIINIENNIEIIDNFKEQITLEKDNINLDEIEQEQKENIMNILNENIQAQFSNLHFFVTIEDYKKMLENLELVDKISIQMPEANEITDIERKRFNSQFEFFVSENLTSDNLNELLKIVENNLKDMKVQLEEGDIEDIDLERLDSNEKEDREYRESISDMLIYIKRDSNNDEKKDEILKFLDIYANSEYDVSIEYDEDGLVKLIRAKIQKD